MLINFYGLYIDVRVSFNSFIPEDLDDKIAEKLVDYYIINWSNLASIKSNSMLFSCYTFDLNERLEKLNKYGFTKLEINKISESFLNLTNKIINPKDGLWKIDENKIYILKKRRNIIAKSQLDKEFKIYWLIEDCKDMELYLLLV